MRCMRRINFSHAIEVFIANTFRDFTFSLPPDITLLINKVPDTLLQAKATIFHAIPHNAFMTFLALSCSKRLAPFYFLRIGQSAP